MREIRYRQIADDLRTQISSGELTAGTLLPSEAELAQAHRVSRVTVRKALEVVRDEGLVDSRQGFGWFVAGEPIRQQLGMLATIEDQLAEQGRRSERRVLAFGFTQAPPRVREVLGVDEVLEVTRCNLADGRPFALVTVWCPATLAGRLSRDDVEASPFYDLLDLDIAGATQTIGAAVADAESADVLAVPVGSPLLVCERISHDEGGRAVLLSSHRFPAHLTQFVVELRGRPRSMVPSGLQLVSDDRS